MKYLDQFSMEAVDIRLEEFETRLRAERTRQGRREINGEMEETVTAMKAIVRIYSKKLEEWERVQKMWSGENLPE